MTLDLIALAYLLDWIIGDPQWLPHPVRLIGLVIETGEDLTRKLASGRVGEFIAGMLLTVVVVSATFAASHYLIRCATIINSLAASGSNICRSDLRIQTSVSGKRSPAGCVSFVVAAKYTSSPG